MRMKHPEHGFTHTDPFYSEAFLRTQGWIGENEQFPGEQASFAGVDAPRAIVVGQDGQHLTEQAVRRPGRPRKGQ